MPLTEERYMFVSTNDSRIRLFKDYVLIHKYKGHDCSRIYSPISVTEDLKFVVSGSQNGRIYVWDTMAQESNCIKLKQYECFQPRCKKKHEYCLLAPAKVMQNFRNLYKTESGDVISILITAGSKDTLRIFANFEL